MIIGTEIVDDDQDTIDLACEYYNFSQRALKDEKQNIVESQEDFLNRMMTEVLTNAVMTATQARAVVAAKENAITTASKLGPAKRPVFDPITAIDPIQEANP